MTKLFTISSEDKFYPGFTGMGAKVVQGHMSIGPASEAVHHSDVNLNTIKELLIEQNAIGSLVFVDVSAPGSYDNYASLTAYDMLGTGGYAATRTAGTLGVQFIAIGE